MSSAELDFRCNGAATPIVASQSSRPAVRRGGAWLVAYAVLMIAGAGTVTGAVAGATQNWTPSTFVFLLLVAIGALWISGGAATAVLGFIRSEPLPAPVPRAWQAHQQTAILVLLCGEPAESLATYLRTLRERLDALGLDGAVSLFVLSDTQEPACIAAEEAVLIPLATQGVIDYRRRADNRGRKPGNIAEWVHRRGEDFDFITVLDADSRMSPERIRSLIFRMEHEPDLGLLQAGICMVPGRSLFGRHQRLSNRLLSPNFAAGLAAWSGDAGNYWGHNAIVRVEAFRSALALPVLSGRAPFGGPPLSHDFVEAAWIRRAGWTVALDPDARGSAEDGPQTLAEFHRRDRRWCQGNLQHLRIVTAPRLDKVSRLHLVSGIVGYLVAPAWLVLMVLVAADAVQVHGFLPLIPVVLILLLPKLLAFAHWARRARTAARRRVIARASLEELAVSTLLAPLVMLRQSCAVVAVLCGRDCGWNPRRAGYPAALAWLPEMTVGAFLLALGAATDLMSLVWLLPVALPLLGAPLLQRWVGRGA